MPSEKFRINTNGQSLRNPSNGFFGMTLSPNLTIDESDASAHNDRRSAHNALERQRREHLNVKFQQLAHALPSLQTVRRPSKTMIVAKSLEFVSSSLKRESNYTSEIQKLREENERLKKQALAASQKLKRQLSESEPAIKVENQEEDEEHEDKDTSSCKTLVEITVTDNKKRKNASDGSSPPKSTKRKITETDLSSPPPTPETSNKSKARQAVVINTPKKKRMVKQTKSTTTTVPESTSTFTNPMMIPPYQQQQQASMPPYSIQQQHQNNYFDIPPPPYNPDLMQQQFNYPQPMVNPMLLAPYYETTTNDFSYNYIQDHQRQSSSESFYNL